MDTTRRNTLGTNSFVFAFHAIHVGRRAADIGKIAFEFGVFGEFFDFFEDGLFTARSDELALVR